MNQPPNQGITRTGPRTAEVMVFAHTLHAGQHAAVQRAEALALDTASADRDSPQTTITWDAVVPPATHHAQPHTAHTRLPWNPGTPLPTRAHHATCTVKVT
jgi:hypothetical protein